MSVDGADDGFLGFVNRKNGLSSTVSMVVGVGGGRSRGEGRFIASDGVLAREVSLGEICSAVTDFSILPQTPVN